MYNGKDTEIFGVKNVVVSNKDWARLKEMKTVKCKWCGTDTTMLGTRECDRCWELRSRIEADMVLAEKMMIAIEYGREEADLLEDDKWAEHFAILEHHQP